jgi:BirA family transcriptional regulator, biotin operon repressor / biotin---[acetyl-CoA-carboxylase] ligase
MRSFRNIGGYPTFEFRRKGGPTRVVSDLSVEVLGEVLGGRYGRPFKYLRATGSTNSDALEWAASGAPEGALVVAEEQRAGRGRWGRSWIAPPHSAILFSLVLRPTGPIRELDLLTTALGVACARGIEVATGLSPGLKWPNDVEIQGRKVAGILVETLIGGTDQVVAVAGVGINVSWPNGEIPGATSIHAELDRRSEEERLSRAHLLSAVLASFELVYPIEDPSLVLQPAAARSTVLGREVVVRLPSGDLVAGVARRLLPSGALELHVDGHPLPVTSGEIQRVRVAGARRTDNDMVEP